MSDETTLLAAPLRVFTRSHLERGPSLAEKVTGEVQKLSYGTILHRMRLRERYPARLLVAPRDPVAGDRLAGETMLAGRIVHGGHSARLAGYDWRAPVPERFRAYMDSFRWVRDLAATQTPRLALIVQPLLAGWLAVNGGYQPQSWAPERIGERLLNWILYSNIILGKAELTVRSSVLTHMARSARHLWDCIERAPEPLPRLRAAAGAVAAGLALPDHEARLARAEVALKAALSDYIGPDGMIGSRAAVDQLELVELVASLDAVYAARGRTLDGGLLPRLAAALRAMVLGDGALAAFHGAPLSGERVTAALRWAGEQSVREPGYQRIESGGSWLLVDAGPPPDQRVSQGCHASTLAFEFGHGAERIIVNCGGARGVAVPPDAELAAVLRTSAAHSTLVVADVNSTRLREDGCLGRGVSEVSVRREEAGDGHFVEAVHDGYRRRYGLDHRRRLFLSADGSDLRGEDELVARQRLHPHPPFAIRFHLHPQLTVEMAENAVLMATPSGAVWAFRCRDARPALEDSIVLEPTGTPRRTKQIVVSGTGSASFAWTLKRVA